MIGYVTIGTQGPRPRLRVLRRAPGDRRRKQLMGMDRIKFYGTGLERPCSPSARRTTAHRTASATATWSPSRAARATGVDKLYAKAMALGASDEGAPGERMPIFYGAYVRDLDGNKLCFFDMKLPA